MATEAALHYTAAEFVPIKIEGLKEGDTKYWCRCGLSKTQPWCDGSHKGTGIAPMPWKVEKTQEAYYLCACKQTKNAPFCDGSHVKAKEEIGERAVKCKNKYNHKDCKMCTGCGWNPKLQF
ncbi:CDGSH iron-sulfur domain-containing protein 3, mitochondrial-like [Mercenaria mercenaria]|uniref:CDGSH iron-sulfur domain-containing protein 3, mitochondrial-like n=1 Tax=Mercenaria mercenaria TaxID=6596 RepID=UPI00234F4B1B|nr:CDGSH iron-sulfur domain-containing protein 3, mitochondrial-like [Mercenaria mercenaria]